MKTLATLGRALLLSSLLVGAAAQADVLVAGDPTQLGRLSRNGIQQTWNHDEAFPGVINPTISYHYHLYYFNVGLTPFIEITVDSTAATTFFAAYQTIYNPTNLGASWLGDPGSSGDFFGVDPVYFDVVAGVNSTLILAVNESTTNGGLGLPFSFTVQGFTDNMYSNPVDLSPVGVTARIPEPSTLLLLGFAPFGLLIARRQTRKRRSEAGVPALAA